MASELHRLKQRLGPLVRSARTARGWTLADLAERLEMSKPRLSEVERGGGSFSAEQLIVLARLFQFGFEDLVEPDRARDPVVGSLQSALAKHGARHLVVDDDFVIRREHARPVDALRDVLIRHASPRFLTSIPPVLLAALPEISFPVLQDAVTRAGVPFRWGWVLNHAVEAWSDLRNSGPVAWRRDVARASTVAQNFLVHIPRPAATSPQDLLDPDLRSAASLLDAAEGATLIDRTWRVLSRLTSDDFIGPLEVCRDAV